MTWVGNEYVGPPELAEEAAQWKNDYRRMHTKMLDDSMASKRVKGGER
jgi:hypothetical protein